MGDQIQAMVLGSMSEFECITHLSSLSRMFRYTPTSRHYHGKQVRRHRILVITYSQHDTTFCNSVVSSMILHYIIDKTTCPKVTLRTVLCIYAIAWLTSMVASPWNVPSPWSSLARSSASPKTVCLLGRLMV
jgi:hypothetical protein